MEPVVRLPGGEAISNRRRPDDNKKDGLPTYRGKHFSIRESSCTSKAAVEAAEQGAAAAIWAATMEHTRRGKHFSTRKSSHTSEVDSELVVVIHCCGFCWVPGWEQWTWLFY